MVKSGFALILSLSIEQLSEAIICFLPLRMCYIKLDFYAGPSARGRQLYCRACNFKTVSALLAGNFYTCYFEPNGLSLLMDTGATGFYLKEYYVINSPEFNNLCAFETKLISLDNLPAISSICFFHVFVIYINTLTLNKQLVWLTSLMTL